MYSPLLSELMEARYAARLAESERRRQLLQAGQGHAVRWLSWLRRPVVSRGGRTPAAHAAMPTAPVSVPRTAGCAR